MHVYFLILQPPTQANYVLWFRDEQPPGHFTPSLTVPLRYIAFYIMWNSASFPGATSLVSVVWMCEH